MKKTFVALCCAFSLCLISCASKPETTDSELPEIQNETEAELEQNQNENESQTEEQSSSDENENSELPDEAVSISLSSKDFPEPDFFEEPEIITLEPEEEKPVIKVSDEPLESEEPPVLENVETEQNAETENAVETARPAGPAETAETAGNSALQQTTESLESASSENDDLNTDTTFDADDSSAINDAVIDITDDDNGYDSNDDYDKSALPKVITPSRSVTLKKFEYLDVTYPGTGWVYMGLTDNSKDLAYFGRKLGTKDTKFTLQARNAGTKIIHFYKNDPLTGRYLDDYLEVIILSENGSNKTHIDAPEYKLPIQKKENPVKADVVTEEKSEEETADKKSVETKTTASSPETSQTSQTSDTLQTSQTAKAVESTKTPESTKVSGSTKTAESTNAAEAKETVATSKANEEVTPEPIETPVTPNSVTLLQEAQLLYNEKEYAAALNKLNQFFEYSTDDRDEALYLKGQILEAKSEIRDIKAAIDAYTSLTKNYPASKLWDSANKRIIYLKRFYLEVR